MAAVRQAEPRNPPDECKTPGCTNPVPTPYVGSCLECFAEVYAEFRRAMGW